MSAHALAMATYRHMKSLPLVGRGTRWAAGHLKTALASWHYSNNRLRQDLTAEVSGEATPTRPTPHAGAPEARLEQLARRLARAEGALARIGDSACVVATLRLTDRDGLVTELSQPVASDLGRFVALSGLADLAVLGLSGDGDADVLVAEALPRLSDYATRGTTLSWSVPARASAGASAATVADAMRKEGLSGIVTAREGDTCVVRGMRGAA